MSKTNMVGLLLLFYGMFRFGDAILAATMNMFGLSVFICGVADLRGGILGILEIGQSPPSVMLVTGIIAMAVGVILWNR